MKHRQLVDETRALVSWNVSFGQTTMILKPHRTGRWRIYTAPQVHHSKKFCVHYVPVFIKFLNENPMISHLIHSSSSSFASNDDPSLNQEYGSSDKSQATPAETINSTLRSACPSHWRTSTMESELWVTSRSVGRWWILWWKICLLPRNSTAEKN